MWHPLKIVAFTPGILGFAAPIHFSPALVPIESVIVIEAETEEAAGDFLAGAAGKGVQGNRRVSTPIEDELPRFAILVEVETDLAVIPLAGTARGVVVGGEVQIIGFNRSDHAVHAEEWIILRERAGTPQIRRHQGQGHPRILENRSARLDYLLAGYRSVQAQVRAGYNQRHQRRADNHLDERERPVEAGPGLAGLPLHLPPLLREPDSFGRRELPWAESSGFWNSSVCSS